MTDNEITKALMICKNGSLLPPCQKCSFSNENKCLGKLHDNALDLINRQRAEIEKLTNKCDDCAGCTQWECDCSLIKDELVKEFANRLKEEIEIELHYKGDIVRRVIDNLVKEMTEGK